MDLKKYLGKTVEVIIDRPKNSMHPKHHFIYEINYGYIPNTKASDGEEIDAYVLGVDYSINRFTGVVIAYIHRFDDDDDKLIVTDGTNYEDDEIKKLTNFCEQFFDSIIIR